MVNAKVSLMCEFEDEYWELATKGFNSNTIMDTSFYADIVIAINNARNNKSLYSLSDIIYSLNSIGFDISSISVYTEDRGEMFASLILKNIGYQGKDANLIKGIIRVNHIHLQQFLDMKLL